MQTLSSGVLVQSYSHYFPLAFATKEAETEDDTAHRSLGTAIWLTDPLISCARTETDKKVAGKLWTSVIWGNPLLKHVD